MTSPRTRTTRSSPKAVVTTAAASAKVPSAALKKTAADAKTASTAGLRRAEELIGLIARRKERIAEDFYDIGKALRELFDKKLHVVLGHRSFDEMLSARKIMGGTQAKQLIRIVSAMPAEQALKLGPEKAYALVRYTAATPALDTPASLLDGGATVDGKPIAETSVRALRDAARKEKARAGGKAKRDPAERAAASAARALGAWIKARGVKSATVTVRRVKGGYRLAVDAPVEMATLLAKGE